MRYAAVILTAGSGSRLGGVAKALIRVDGTPLVVRLIGALRGAGIHELLLVTGAHHDALAEIATPMGIRVIRNPEPISGRRGSVRAGLQAIDASVDAVMMVLCDQPLLTASDLLDLRAAFERRGHGEFVVPQVDGRRGNPVLVSRPAVRAVLLGGPDIGCREFMDTHPQTVWTMYSGNDHYLVDIDQPRDLARAAARLGCPVELPG